MTPADLYAWRHALGLSQQKAAERLGIRLNSYQELERGHSFGPTSKPRRIDARTVMACELIIRGIKPRWTVD